MTPSTPKLCECGCGAPTNMVMETKPRRGLVRGQYRRYLKGHHRRTTVAPPSGYMVDETTGCWVWLLAKTRNGYGRSKRNGKPRHAHIIEWERANGPVPDGLHLDHTCRNPACVNPAHLEPVTQAENNRRSRSTRLTVDEVLQIRASGLRNKDVAVQFGVTASHVSRIRSGERWIFDNDE